MKNEARIKLFLVDDDSVFLKSLEIDFCQHENFQVQTFSTGELCLEHINEKPDIIVLDYYLDGIVKEAMNGIQTLDKIKAFDAEIPVIMLSSQDKIEIAISCMHHKAFDYVVKSETSYMRLHHIMTAIYKYKRIEKELRWYMERM